MEERPYEGGRRWACASQEERPQKKPVLPLILGSLTIKTINLCWLSYPITLVHCYISLGNLIQCQVGNNEKITTLKYLLIEELKNGVIKME